ncbi:MAG TPA: glucokinase [Candidatus Angelobacter sp.]|nr:glucokinase [Candidatus Angelobacter sp.]
MILAGDIGGTHTRLGLFDENAGRLRLQSEKNYPSREHTGLAEIVSAFLSAQNIKVERACFGIAGPVLNGRVVTPNLPWVIDVLPLGRETGIETVFLINDLQAHASGIDDLAAGDFVNLNAVPQAAGNAALIAAGTGLGEAGLYWDGTRRQPFPCEGGHCDFAPRNDLEIALLHYLQGKFGRVSYERVLSGPGLKNIYEFLRDCGVEQEPPWLHDELAQSPDPVAGISQHGLEGTAPICERALDIFVGVYGAEAGNLALKLMATGGVFLSGGIAARILPKLTAPAFMQAFAAKGRMQPLLAAVPVKIVTNDRVGLIGAARYAMNVSDKLKPLK